MLGVAEPRLGRRDYERSMSRLIVLKAAEARRLYTSIGNQWLP